MRESYRAGDFWRICQRCGIKRRASDTSKEWTGLIVCSDTCWEPRHDQDFVRGRKDRQRVPDPSPEPADYFLVPGEVTGSSIDGIPRWDEAEWDVDLWG